MVEAEQTDPTRSVVRQDDIVHIDEELFHLIIVYKSISISIRAENCRVCFGRERLNAMRLNIRDEEFSNVSCDLKSVVNRCRFSETLFLSELLLLL